MKIYSSKEPHTCINENTNDDKEGDIQPSISEIKYWITKKGKVLRVDGFPLKNKDDYTYCGVTILLTFDGREIYYDEEGLPDDWILLAKRAGIKFMKMYGNHLFTVESPAKIEFTTQDAFDHWMWDGLLNSNEPKAYVVL